MSEEKEAEYNLKKSIERFGVILPVIKDAEGKTIDGLHREEIDPNAPSATLDWVKTDADRELVRLILNYCRRKVEPDELKNALDKIASLTGWSPRQISDKTSIPVRTIYKYLSKEFKGEEPEELRRARVHVEEPVTLQPLVECDRCHMANRDITVYKGFKLCPSCLEEAKRKPVGRVQIPPSPPLEPVKEYKPKETAEYRRARMSPMVSHMEQRLAERLTEAGVAFESQKEYCIKKTVPDFVINDKAFFIDYEKLHIKREEKDEDARTRLRQFHNIEPFGLPYKADTKAEEERLFKQIMDRIS